MYAIIDEGTPSLINDAIMERQTVDFPTLDLSPDTNKLPTFNKLSGLNNLINKLLKSRLGDLSKLLSIP